VTRCPECGSPHPFSEWVAAAPTPVPPKVWA
jgi:hypothetical protein